VRERESLRLLKQEADCERAFKKVLKIYSGT
jgi:hypothetical protein